MIRKLLNFSKKLIPKISNTERIALNSGNVSIDFDIFNGKLSNKYIINKFSYPTLSKESIINSSVQSLCSSINDDEIFRTKEIPKEIYESIAKKKLYGMIIPKKYNGLDLNHHEQSQIVQKISTASTPVGITVMVPNSLGPAELLLKYGTFEQKNEYLPKLASGELIPCFGLTGQHSGSDAASMGDTGILIKKDNKKFINLNLSKRYITLAPIANLVGVAFVLKDPNSLLKDGKEGITLALLSRDGLKIGNYHNPMDIPFKNGTIEANNLLIPLDNVIGGEKYVGEGWKMLMECLSVGRAISLPACAVGSAKLTLNYAGAYSIYRKQFKTMLADMEGVQQKLAIIGTETLKITSMQYLTNSILDNGFKPSVISAIMKYETTERSRIVVNHGMDIVAGAGICKGNKNFLGNLYQAIPIGITVEGSNTLTKNLIIFGQGLMKSHPYLYKLVCSIEDNNLYKFKENLKNIIMHSLNNGTMSLYYKSYCNIMFLSKDTEKITDKYLHNFAITSNLILLLGQKFKSSEMLSGRMAEILGSLYIIKSLNWFETHNPDVKYIAELARYEEIIKIQNNFNDISNNYPLAPIRLLIKFLVNNTNMNNNIIIKDTMIKKVSDEITKNIKVRSILSENIYMNDRLRLINNNLIAILKYNNTKGIVDEQLDYIINEVTMVDSYESKK